jgi:bisphosphoglycerate-dependent phosphoglycerate mutase
MPDNFVGSQRHAGTPVRSDALNERDYGELTGLTKGERWGHDFTSQNLIFVSQSVKFNEVPIAGASRILQLFQ